MSGGGGEEKKAGLRERVGSFFRRGSHSEAEGHSQAGDGVEMALAELLGEAPQLLNVPPEQLQDFRVFMQQQAAQAAFQQPPMSFPMPQSHFAMGVSTGGRRVLRQDEIVVKAEPTKPVVFVDVVTLETTNALIKERELMSGVDLSEERINAERAMEATLDKSIPRLISELECAYGRKREYASKRPHWEYAEGRRNNYKNSCRVDRTLRKPQEVDPQQVAADKAFAEKRKLETEMLKLQERMRRVGGGN